MQKLKNDVTFNRILAGLEFEMDPEINIKNAGKMTSVEVHQQDKTKGGSGVLKAVNAMIFDLN